MQWIVFIIRRFLHYALETKDKLLGCIESYIYWERILKTMKQQIYNFIKNIIVFFFNFIWTNNRGETKLYFLPIGRNQIVHQEKKNFLDEIVVELFLKSAPWLFLRNNDF